MAMDADRKAFNCERGGERRGEDGPEAGRNAGGMSGLGRTRTDAAEPAMDLHHVPRRRTGRNFTPGGSAIQTLIDLSRQALAGQLSDFDRVDSSYQV
jgi:hypothetical protein